MIYSELFEQTLREVEISSYGFAQKLQTFFIKYLKINLTKDFYKRLAEDIVLDFLKKDKSNEGLILISDDETIEFIDGNKNVIAEVCRFVDKIISHCEEYAKIWKESRQKLSENQEKFIQYFNEEKYVNEMIPELVRFISEAPPRNEKTPSNYKSRPGYSGPR